jgi:anti-sigma regulatory factor (Ser/Thr protein kinase)
LNLRLDVTPVSMKLDVPSDLGMVGDAVELVATHLPPGTLSPRRISFNLRTALAEALGNAIRYGNGEDPDRFVRVYVELGRDFVRIHVDDDGHGFDSSRVPDPTHPDNLEREDGRGLFVIRHLVDDVAFNKKGNGICLTLRAG